MRRPILLLVIGCMCTASAVQLAAQTGEQQTVVVYEPAKKYFTKRGAFKLNFPGLGIGFEQVIVSNVTLTAETGIYYNYTRLFKRNREDRVLFYPKLRVDLRYYYNAARRQAAGKNIEGFSANYFCFMIQYILNPNVVAVGAAGNENEYWDFRQPLGHGVGLSFSWGMQRRFARYGFYDLQLGPQVINGFDQQGEARVSILPNVRIGVGVML